MVKYNGFDEVLSGIPTSEIHLWDPSLGTLSTMISHDLRLSGVQVLITHGVLRLERVPEGWDPGTRGWDPVPEGGIRVPEGGNQGTGAREPGIRSQRTRDQEPGNQGPGAREPGSRSQRTRVQEQGTRVQEPRSQGTRRQEPGAGLHEALRPFPTFIH